MSEAPAEQRIGDRERRAVDEQLQAAVGDGVLTLAEYDERAALLWQSRTRTELERLVADLPAHAASGRPVAATRTAAPEAVAVPPPPRPSVLTRLKRRVAPALVPLVLLGGAAGVVASGEDARAVFGSTTEVVPDRGRADVVEVSVLFGSVTVVVPDDAQVDTGGLVVLGSVDCDVCAAPGDGQRIEVVGRGGFGSVEVVRASDHRAARDDEDG